MQITGIILSGLAVILIGIAWIVHRKIFNGILFMVILFGFFSTISNSIWKMIFGGLSAVIAIGLLIFIGKRKLEN